MNQYELAVLRVLLKSATPLSKSKVVNGFPDNSSDFVLSAISDLKQANFIVCRDEGSGGDEILELIKERKKDVLALINPKVLEDDHNTKPDSNSSKGRGTMWITATLVIVGALASVYMAYAVGVNDRIASQQLVQQPIQDVTFKVVRLPDGKTVGILGGPASENQFLPYPSQGRMVSAAPAGDFFIEYQPGNALVKYYGASKIVPFTLDAVEPMKS
jgi:hypothetical protein